LGVVGVLWVLVGYSTAFGSDLGGAGLLGNPVEFFGLTSLLGEDQLSGSIPTMAFVGFQAMFAILTVALISGAVADRARCGAWLLFAALWAVVVYFPVAHWVFAFDETDEAGNVLATGGWIANRLAAIDFAGGTAVHINAGAAALALTLVLGRRRGWPGSPGKPHNLPFVVLGAGLLFFGWFGLDRKSTRLNSQSRENLVCRLHPLSSTLLPYTTLFRSDRQPAGGDRLRRRHRGAHQRRRGRPGPDLGAGQAARLAREPGQAAQPAVRGPRRGTAVLRLVRL